MLGLYGLLVSIAVTGLLYPYHKLRQGLRGEDPGILPQLLGVATHPPATPADIIIHGVSAGEMRAAAGIAQQIARLQPTLRLLLSSSTAAGLELGRSLQQELPTVIGVCRLPWDRRQGMETWLQSWSPKAMVVVETELWPNLFDTCRRLQIPLALASARLYATDVWRYRLIRTFMRQVLDSAHWIGVQDETQRQHFLSIGADPRRLSVMGNAKASLPAPSTNNPLGLCARGDQPARLLVAGSTHAPEETWLMQALATLRPDFPDLRLVLAPRQSSRCATVAKKANRQGWRCRLLSQGNWRSEDWDLLLLDGIGHLLPFYAAADLVVLGGSLARHGGHNFLEPASLQKAVICGPNLKNFGPLAERFIAQGALLQVSGRRELSASLRRLLADPATAHSIGRKAGRLAAQERQLASHYGHGVISLLHSGTTQAEKSRST